MTTTDEHRISEFLAAQGKHIIRMTAVPDVARWAEKYAGMAESTLLENVNSSDSIYEVLVREADDSKTLLHVVAGSEIRVLTGDCQITFDEVPLAAFVEYRFSEDSEETWRVASVTEDALRELKKTMFASWEEQIRRPSCEAAFRRLLQAGPISKVFDKHLFPTPDALKSKYQVVHETSGKLIDLPHPVDKLRVFDPESDAYREIDGTLDGAPRGAEATRAYFARLMLQLHEQFGADYVSDLLRV